MRIVLDLTSLVTGSTWRGIGRYVRGLVEGLSSLPPEARSGLDIVGLGADPKVSRLFQVEDLAAYCANVPAKLAKEATNRRSRLITWRLARNVPKDALFHLSEPLGMPFKRRYSLTSFDLIKLVFPRQYLSRLPGAESFETKIERFRYSRAVGILAISHATKRDICDKLDIDPNVVHVTWLGVDHERFNAQPKESDSEIVSKLLGGTDPYVLWVGAGDFRKDIGTLIDAFSESKAKNDGKLVIAGPIDSRRGPQLEAQIRSRGLERRARLVGYVPEDAIPALYRQARAHVFASRYEGFGLPVLEALACGTPTITSPGSSLDEVAGDAALIVPCGEPGVLRDALDRLFFEEELRRTLRERGIARARTFTWRDCAEKSVEFFRNVAVRGAP